MCILLGFIYYNTVFISLSLSCDHPDDENAWSKNVSDLITKYFLVLCLDLLLL